MKTKECKCSRDKKGRIVKREFKDYTMCVHASVGGRENMWVLVAEVYEEDGIQDVSISERSK